MHQDLESRMGGVERLVKWMIFLKKLKEFGKFAEKFDREFVTGICQGESSVIFSIIFAVHYLGRRNFPGIVGKQFS
jgi:hypothetical protein